MCCGGGRPFTRLTRGRGELRGLWQGGMLARWQQWSLKKAAVGGGEEYWAIGGQVGQGCLVGGDAFFWVLGAGAVHPDFERARHPQTRACVRGRWAKVW